MCLLMKKAGHCSSANALQLLFERLLVKLANNVIQCRIREFSVGQGFYWSSRFLLVMSSLGFIRLIDCARFPQEKFRKFLSRFFGSVFSSGKLNFHVVVNLILFSSYYL